MYRSYNSNFLSPLSIIMATLNWEVINASFAETLKLNSSFIFISFLTDLAPR